MLSQLQLNMELKTKLLKNSTYAFVMSDKYIMGLYAQCLSARKAVVLENIELEDYQKWSWVW